jgi:hypothetical protein
LPLSSEEFLQTQNWRQRIVRYVMEENVFRRVLLVGVAAMCSRVRHVQGSMRHQPVLKLVTSYILRTMESIGSYVCVPSRLFLTLSD